MSPCDPALITTLIYLHTVPHISTTGTEFSNFTSKFLTVPIKLGENMCVRFLTSVPHELAQ